MPTRATRRCSTPGCTNTAERSGYCAERHAAQHEAARRRTVPTKVAEREWTVRKYRAAVVRQHVKQHGWVCLGDKHHERHETRDLTADDPIAIARGGNPMQPLAVMCRTANSRKAARG